jgi:hypothetical protein
MKRNFKFMVSLIYFRNQSINLLCLISTLSLLTGCSNVRTEKSQPSSIGSDRSISVSKDFVREISKADYVVVTNTFGSTRYSGFSQTISGKKMKQIIDAIKTAKGDPYQPSASVWDWQLQFFHRKQLLGVANFQSLSIFIDTEYLDESGVLESLYDEMLQNAKIYDQR